MNAWIQPTVSTNTQKHESTHGTSLQSLQYYQSTGGNQRLVIKDNNIVGYEYRNGTSEAWRQSGDPSRYTALIRGFQNQNLHRVIESSPRVEPESGEIIPLRQTGDISSSSPTNISMMVLGGIIAVVGITAVAIAFTVLNAATLGIAGLTVASVGVALALSGVGLFAVGVNKNSQPMVDESLSSAPSSF